VADTYAEHTTDRVIAALYLAQGGDPRPIEQGIVTGTLPQSWYPTLLQYYAAQSELTEQQQILRSELAQLCIAQDVMQSDLPDVFRAREGRN